MKWISNWIQGIIIAVIVGTIIEMILPEGNCKKYIKVVIGVYILFSIVSPVITKITGNDFRVSNVFDLDKYIETSSQNTKQDLGNKQQSQIRDVYIASLKNDMKEKIIAKGYKIEKIELEILDDEQYTLKKIFVTLKQDDSEDENNIINKVESINEIKINIESKNGKINNTSTNTDNNKSIISNKQQKELKQYLSSIYNLEEKNININ